MEFSEIARGQLYVDCPRDGTQLVDRSMVRPGDKETVEFIKDAGLNHLLVDGEYLLAECPKCDSSYVVKKA